MRRPDNTRLGKKYEWDLRRTEEDVRAFSSGLRAAIAFALPSPTSGAGGMLATYHKIKPVGEKKNKGLSKSEFGR